MTRTLCSFMAVFFFALSTGAHAATLTSLIGDKDFFGLGAGTYGVTTITRLGDNNTAPDPEFTDRNWPQYLFNNGQTSPPYVASWQHTLTALSGTNINSARLDIAMADIQDGNHALDDLLFFNNAEVAGAFDTVDQGPGGTGIVSFDLTASQIASFVGNGHTLDVSLHGDNNGLPGLLNIDWYWIDYAELVVDYTATTLTPVPLPTAAWLFLSILAAVFTRTITLSCRR